MAQLLGLLGRALSILGEVLGVVLGIRELTSNSAQEHLPYAIETISTNTQLAVQNPWHGLEAAHAEREAILAAISDLQTATLNAVALTVQAAEPPAWYSGPIPGEDIASAVWSFHLGDSEPVYNLLTWLENDAYHRELWASYPLRTNPLFIISGPFERPPD